MREQDLGYTSLIGFNKPKTTDTKHGGGGKSFTTPTERKPIMDFSNMKTNSTNITSNNTATPTTTSQTQNQTTRNVYNTDYSLYNKLKPDINDDIYTAQYKQAQLDTINQMANKVGYLNPYTYNDLLNKIYQPGVQAKLDNALYGVDLAQNSYGQSLNDLNRATIDAIRSETASAIASGASRAITDANVLKSILGLQQESIADATELAQQRQQAYMDYGVNLAQAYEDAYNSSTAAQQYLANLAESDWWNRQQSLDAAYAADRAAGAQLYASDNAIAQAALNNIMNQILESNTTTKTTTNSK